MTTDHKLIIYQVLPRLFGNTKQLNKYYGSIEENGCGKFNDISDKALQELQKMGFTHIWYTGVIEHAMMTDYSEFGIQPDDPDVVKGRAGSPYAVKDYYDVDPDLATDVNNRVAEYEALILRTHSNGMKVIMDFVPNHVARTYHSDVKPKGIRDFGQDDNTTKAFSPLNDFYYIPGKPFIVPVGYNPGGEEFSSPLKDGKFDENPARATGDDCFTATPSLMNWFETAKLNYGVDYSNGQKYFDPIPPVWNKMYDILAFWSVKGIDGFRCDMVEMVPVEFWTWVITKLKAAYPELIFIGEAYKTSKYNEYIIQGGFDYLYDKVGLYDAIRKLTYNQWDATTWDINKVWNRDCKGIDQHMLRFMENHDEQRVTSKYFAGTDPWKGVPGMIITATLNTGPVMIYCGQEVGEPGAGVEGFSNEDGRTTIFDYWGMPEHQKWMNNGLFDGGQLSDSQKGLREFYSKLLNISRQNEAIREGKFWELMVANERQPGFDIRLYLFLRYTDKQRILVIANFKREPRNMHLLIPPDLLKLLQLSGSCEFTDLLTGVKFKTDIVAGGVEIDIPACGGLILEF